MLKHLTYISKAAN